MAYLTLTNISKVFGQTAAVEDFNLEIQQGEFVSFLGPSGCGKTTTLRMVAGFETPTTGAIQLNGQDLTSRPPNQRHIGMVFQSYALFPNLTVGENIGFGLKVAHRPQEEIRERVEEMLKLIHLEALGKRYPYQLSGGQQQRVALARALAIRPQVLLLDEPLSALDAKIRVELRNEIHAIQRRLNIATIYVTHDQEEALSLSDRIVVMNAGRIEQIGTPFEIYNFPRTHFVAAFVGTLNVLEAAVRDARQGILEVDGQEIRTGRVFDQPGTVTLALRPEIISLDGQGTAGNHLKGTVESIEFLGGVVRVHVRVGPRVLYLDTLNNPHLDLPAEGSPVTLSFPPEACLILG
ncbi:MAG TPA: ABC transporter ATP-binding protein [Anaerolineaceae bacterium]